MSPTPDNRFEDFRSLRGRVRRQPENFGAFLGELHTFLHDLYESAARAGRNEDGFEKALAALCTSRGITVWEDFLSPDEQRQFFKDTHDPAVQRMIAFWTELDEPLGW